MTTEPSQNELDILRQEAERAQMFGTSGTLVVLPADKLLWLLEAAKERDALIREGIQSYDAETEQTISELEETIEDLQSQLAAAKINFTE